MTSVGCFYFQLLVFSFQFVRKLSEAVSDKLKAKK